MVVPLTPAQALGSAAAAAAAALSLAEGAPLPGGGTSRPSENEALNDTQHVLSNATQACSNTVRVGCALVGALGSGRHRCDRDVRNLITARILQLSAPADHGNTQSAASATCVRE